MRTGRGSRRGAGLGVLGNSRNGSTSLSSRAQACGFWVRRVAMASCAMRVEVLLQRCQERVRHPGAPGAGSAALCPSCGLPASARSRSRTAMRSHSVLAYPAGSVLPEGLHGVGAIAVEVGQHSLDDAAAHPGSRTQDRGHEGLPSIPARGLGA